MTTVKPDFVAWTAVTRAGCLEDGTLWGARLTESEVKTLSVGHPRIMIECYVSADTLRVLAELLGVGLEEAAKELLPTRANVRSGDFGEMLIRRLAQERGDRPQIPLMKWRAKTSPDDLVRGTDLIGYVMAGAEPSRDDVLVLFEVKTRSASVNPKIVQVALDQVTSDYASRLANQLFFQQKQLVEHGLHDDARRLARFRKPHEHPFRKRLVAAIVHEEETWDEAFLEHLPERHGATAEVEVLILRIEKLLEWIHEMYEQVPACAGDYCISD